MQKKLDTLRAAYAAGKTRPVEFRKKQLRALLRMYEENAEEIVAALSQDLHKSRQETLTMEIKVATNDIRECLANMDEWAKPERPSKSFVNWLDSVYVMREPYGVVLVVSAWNYPVQLLMVPAAGAIAAGNCVVMKPSELAPATARFLETTLPKYLDPTCYAVMNGGIPETTELLKERFDYIFFTGSGKVGRIVHQAANRHLTPVTLELGGKSPVYIDDTVDLKIALKRLLWGKLVNAGQTCIAPDYVLCTTDVQEKIIKHLPAIIEGFYGKKPKDSPDYCRIINAANFKRVVPMLTDASIAYGGDFDSSQYYIGPTVLKDVNEKHEVMKDEIFAPILPIVPVKNLSEAIEFINKREKPLALYIFSKRSADIWNIINSTSSGGVCVNDTVMHFVVDGVPFGGVGGSGMGRYHGKYSFDTFTHFRSCLYKNYNPVGESLASSRYPPYSDAKTRFLLNLISWRPGVPGKYFRDIFTFILGLATAYFYQKYYLLS